MKRIIFIVNGGKKQTKKLKAILDFFSNSTFFSKVEVNFTQYPGHAEEIARESSSKFDYLIVVGGDGTLNEVVNGFDFASKIVIGLLPFGTANDFARGQKLQLDAAFLFELIKKDTYKSIDVGLVTSFNSQSTINRRFINIADIGLGGYVTQEMIKSKNQFFSGKINYASAILKGMINYSKPELIVKGDYNFQGRVLTLAVCNGSYFGYGLCIAPKANIQNGALNITCVGNVSILDYLKNLHKIKRGDIIDHPEIAYTSIQSIEVNHTNEACPIEVDGEFIGYTPVTIQLLPSKLKFLLP